MTHEYDITFIQRALTGFLPGARVVFRNVPRKTVEESYVRSASNIRAGFFNPKDGSVIIWVHIENDRSIEFRIDRPDLPLSAKERKFLMFAPDVLEHTLPQKMPTEPQQLQRLSSRNTLALAVVAKFLHNKFGGRFWQPSYLISVIQELVSQNYEGALATSGFILICKREELQRDEITARYDVSLFTKSLKFSESFFDEPLAYRYVDGRNAFFLINRLSEVFGILRIRDPLNYSLSDRIFGEHLIPLLKRLTAPAWAIYVGNNRDIQIITQNGPELRWNKARWQYLHLPNIENYLAENHVDKSAAKSLIRLIMCLSVMRVGSLILIPSGEKRPVRVNTLEAADLQKEIFDTIAGKHIDEFLSGAGLFGVFGSDGTVTLSRSGFIEDAGAIVGVGRHDQAIAGGGRTQAARVCSRYGLAIKVSEDGPISFFLNDREVLKTNG